MAAENRNSSQFGFAAAPSFGFAAAGNRGKSYGSFAPHTGFAADMRAAEGLEQPVPELSTVTIIDESEQYAEERRHDTSVIERIRSKRGSVAEAPENDRALTDDGYSRLTATGIVIGRRVQVTKGSGWRAFEADLQSRSDAYQTVPYNRLTMSYFNETETGNLIDQVLQRTRRRIKTPGEERTVINGFREKLRDDMARLVQLDLDNEAMACALESDDHEAMLDMLEQIKNPDRHAFFSGNHDRITNNAGIFSTATFLFRGLGSIGIHTKTMTLEDYTEATTIGRNKLIDVLGSNYGLNTSHLSEEWDGPQIPIWHMVGRHSLAGFRYAMPAAPLDITLGPASVFEQQ